MNYIKITKYCKVSLTSKISFHLLKVKEIKTENSAIVVINPSFDVNNNQIKSGLFKLACLVKKLCFKIIKILRIIKFII